MKIHTPSSTASLMIIVPSIHLRHCSAIQGHPEQDLVQSRRSQMSKCAAKVACPSHNCDVGCDSMQAERAVNTRCNHLPYSAQSVARWLRNARNMARLDLRSRYQTFTTVYQAQADPGTAWRITNRPVSTPSSDK